MTADPRPRIGLAGYGFGGRYFHAPMLASLDGIEFVGVMTRSSERQSLVTAEHAVPCFDTVAALADGAETVGRLVVPHQNRRWDSDLLTVRAVLKQGVLGEVQRFESRFERLGTSGAVPAAGGGLLYDFGSHLVDQALLLFGPVDTVYAETGPPARAARSETRFFASLTHRSGTVSHLFGDWVQGAPRPRFRVVGSEGAFVVGPGMVGQEQALIDGGSPGADGSAWGIEPESAWGWQQRGAERTPVRSECGRWDLLYTAFAEAVAGRGEAPVTVAEAIASLTMIDACAESARTGDVVRLTV